MALQRTRAARLGALLLALFYSTTGLARPLDFSFTGVFDRDDNVRMFNFVTDGLAPVTMRTFGYAGGVQADANNVVAGGFDPVVWLFDAAGTNLDFDDDGTAVPGSCAVGIDPVTGAESDSCLVSALAAGSYIVALTQFDNVPIGNLGAGFSEYGNPAYTGAFGCGNEQFCDVGTENRTGNWALDIQGVLSANSIPEPGALALFGLAIAGLGASRKSRRLNKTA